MVRDTEEETSSSSKPVASGTDVGVKLTSQSDALESFILDAQTIHNNEE